MNSELIDTGVRTLASITCAILGTTMPFLASVINAHIPVIVMEIGQCIAWYSAGGIFAFTVYKHIKDRINVNKK